MASHSNFSKSLQETQLRFEDDLLATRFEQGEIFNVEKLGFQYSLPHHEAKLILECAFRKGLLNSHGPGGYIQRRTEAPSINSVFQHAEKSGLKPKSIVRSVELIPASSAVAKILKINPGAPIYQQKRSRLINQVVIGNQCNYIPECITPDLDSLDLQNNSFQVALERKYHTVVHAIQEDFSLSSPTDEDRVILDLRENEKILIVQRLSLSTSKLPLVWADIHVNPTYFHWVERLWPQAAKLLKSKEIGAETE